jgi:hypothetical protein
VVDERDGIMTKEGHKEKLIMERWQMKGMVYGQKKVIKRVGL